MPSDTPGALFSAVIFIVLLVAIGFGLAELSRGRIEISEKVRSLRDTAAGSEQEISILTSALIQAEERFHNASENANPTRLEAALSANAETTKAIEDLQQKNQETQENIRNLKADFLDYTETYRKQQWKDAVGERINVLTLRSGRRLEKIIITRVTDDGLHVTHTRGASHVLKENLSFSMRERFQWSLEDVPGIDWNKVSPDVQD